MKIIHDLIQLSERSEDQTGLSEDIISELKKNIVKGAKDNEQSWANALELVHRAYKVSGVQRPSPDMVSAWKQYEILIQYAVEQLAKYRGLDGDWRMSSHIFHEAMEKQFNFKVHAIGGNFGEGYVVKVKHINNIVDKIKAKNTDLYDIDVKHISPQKINLLFSKWGIKKNYKLKIEQINK